MFIIQLYHSLFTWGRHQKEYCKKNEIGGKFGRGGGEMSEKLLTQQLKFLHYGVFILPTKFKNQHFSMALYWILVENVQ